MKAPGIDLRTSAVGAGEGALDRSGHPARAPSPSAPAPARTSRRVRPLPSPSVMRASLSRRARPRGPSLLALEVDDLADLPDRELEDRPLLDDDVGGGRHAELDPAGAALVARELALG